ncbi:MAG: cobalamin B12-binding domain-containing protein [Planctomycetes bacterium]|nr:cobalamin B12-binding domain-containing protein [Planctomycetota bacterium]
MQNPRRPLSLRPRVLLTSVFGPYGSDDDFGSRRLNPMELYQNQVTRVQGPFSLRMFHRSWGIMMIQANIEASTNLLDFPTLERFEREIADNRYDVIGITGIQPNIGKVAAMCERIRLAQPEATIVVGGHVANAPDVERRLDADHIVRGDGIRWFRRFLGEPEDRPVRHPLIFSGIGARAMGISLSERPGEVAATLIPSVGCPMGCNFCATSAMFGGKGRHIDFYETGDELYDLMTQMERQMQVRSFFIMDENFLLHRKRALRLLELMERGGKAWALYVFSSANVLGKYTIEELVGLGVSWVWMGLEGEDAPYAKLKGTDTRSLVRRLQSHGIRVLGSSIIGMESHDLDNIDRVIDHAVSHETDFHQFMLYTPVSGTPLHREHQANGTLLSTEGQEHDIHGQLRFNFTHPRLPPGAETELLVRAFERDFETNGPSVVRLASTLLAGWRRYKDHPEPRIRERYRWETRDLGKGYAGAVWAAERWFRARGNSTLADRIGRLGREIASEFGLKARILAPLAGRYVLAALGREDRRLRNGWTYEPPTFYETNVGAEQGGPFLRHPAAGHCRWVETAPPMPSRVAARAALA